MKKLPIYDAEVWLVCCRPLRCFIHPGPGYVNPLRPPALIIARLRHQPAVLRCQPLALAPDEPVDGVDVINHIQKTIVFPRIPDYLPSDANGKYPVPTANSPRIPHRPGKILFEDISLAYTCIDSLRSLGIQVQVVRMELPLLPFISLFSQSLVKLGIAQATKMTFAPGLNDITNLPPSIYRGLLLAARDFAQSNPWIVVPDKQSFRIRFDPVTDGPMTQEPLIAWANIIGQGEFRSRFMQIEKMGKNPDSLPYNHTISVYFKRYDLEMNLMKATYVAQAAQQREEDIKNGKQITGPLMLDFEKIPSAEPNPYDLVCACCKKQGTDSKIEGVLNESSSSSSSSSATTTDNSSADTQSQSNTSSSITKRSVSTRLSRCTRCRDVYYCSETCQKTHWKDHRSYCDDNKCNEIVKTPTPGKQIGYNTVREIRIAFQRPFDVPCGDIEVMEKLNVLPDHRDNYPLIMVVKNGATYPPSPGEVGWAVRVLSAIVAFWRARPDTVHILRPIQHEETVRLTRTVYPLAIGEEERNKTAATKSNVSSGPEKKRLTANEIQAEYSKDEAWYDKFMDNTVCYVRTDPILSRDETKELIEEINDMTKNKFDKAVIKPGIYVPTVWTLPPKDYVDFVDDNDDTVTESKKNK